MKILAIRGRNIASLDGEFEVDFTSEPLISAGIFAISGSTGAGKSTLLDTMCLALFARTPRTDQAKENEVWLKDVKDSALTQGDARNLLRRGAISGYAEVDFLALNGHRYRSRWSVRRARDKETGALQNYKISIFDLDTEKEEQGNRKELQNRIIELVGLTFDQFTRSVLLAQNDFSTFLKADQSEKATLLEKLTGTELYSAISQLIYQRNIEAKDAYEQLRRQIEGVDLLTEEEFLQLQTRQQEMESTLYLLNKEKAAVENKLKWFRELEELAANVEEARRELAQIRIKWEENKPRIVYLDQVMQVQEARSMYIAEKNVNHTLQEKSQQLQKCNEQIEQTFSVYERISCQHAQFIKEYEELEAQYKSIEPQLKEARQIDIRMDELISVLRETETRLAKASNNRMQREKEDLLLCEKLSANATDIASLTEWREKHVSREHVAEQVSLLTLQLDHAEAARRDKEAASARFSKLQFSLRGLEENEVKKKEALTVKQQLSRQVGESLTKLQDEQQKDIPLEVLQAQIHSIREQKEMLRAGAICWKELDGLESEWFTRKKLRDESEQALTSLERESVQHADLLKMALQGKLQAEHIYNSAMLAVADGVEKLRSRLEDNHPCPVCGSTEHPYAGTDEKLHLALTVVREEVMKSTRQYDEELKNTERLKQSVTNLAAEIGKQTLELKALTKKIDTAQESWNTFDLPECKSLDPEKRHDWFLAAYEKATRSLEDLLQKERCISGRQQKMQGLLQEHMSLLQQVNSFHKEVQDISNEKQLNLNNQETERAIIRSNENILQEALTSINDLFDNEKWQVAWEKDSKAFRQTLTDFAVQWEENKRKLQEKQTQQTRLLAEQKAMNAYLPTLMQAEDNCRKDLDAQQKQLEALKSNRKELLNGRAVSEVESNFQSRIGEKKKNVSATQAELEKVSHLYEQSKGTISQIKSDLQLLTEQAAACRQQLDIWLSSFNTRHLEALTYKGLEELLAKDSQWIQSERSEINRLNSNLVAVQAKLREREEKLKVCNSRRIELEINESTPESLQTLSGNMEERQQKQTALHTECSFKLRNHLENKEKIRSLEEELKRKQVIYDQWSKLNDLAGSSDGGKFRRIAQGYTLDVLLGYANVHLRSLSRRYRLERVPETLALQVIDREMCDEVRTVHSLSGGESFLVSLALALGLSSLSSNQMNVESLFIDEGFGSLDADTLRIALDALESLRTQGRKIGVISHVQEMTERIPVQVKVEKLGNGKSKVCIYS